MILSNDQIEFYNNEGYVLVEDVISEDQLSAMIKIVDDFFEKSKAIKENNSNVKRVNFFIVKYFN